MGLCPFLYSRLLRTEFWAMFGHLDVENIVFLAFRHLYWRATEHFEDCVKSTVLAVLVGYPMA